MHPTKTFKTKWGHIKYAIRLFFNAYKQVLDCMEFGTPLDNILEQALEQGSPSYIDCICLSLLLGGIEGGLLVVGFAIGHAEVTR